MSQTLDAVLQKGQTMPEKNRFPAVLQPVCATGEQTHCLTASSSKGATEDGTGRRSPIVIDRAAFNQGENAQYDPHIGEADVMDTVVARGPHAVGVRDAAAGIPFRKAKRAQDSRVTGPHAVAPTVAAKFGTGGGNVPLVNAEPHIVQASELRLKGQISEQSTCPTLLANTKSGDNDPLAVHAISFQPGNLCRQAGADPSTTTFPTLKCDAGDQAPHVAHPMAVRRLTPNECLRLQGFPDNWTNIPWKGKPEGQAPDGPQYKCAGNSFAVPVVRWIGTRIAAQP